MGRSVILAGMYNPIVRFFMSLPKGLHPLQLTRGVDSVKPRKQPG